MADDEGAPIEGVTTPANLPEQRTNNEVAHASDEDTIQLPLYVVPRERDGQEGFVVEAQPLATEFRREMRLHRGPLPSPEDMEAYDRVVPGLAREMSKMLLAEQHHRMEIDDKIVRGGTRTQYLAYSYGMTLMIFAMILALVHNDLAAIAFAGIDVAGVAGGLAFQSRRRKKSLSEEDDG